MFNRQLLFLQLFSLFYFIFSVDPSGLIQINLILFDTTQ